MSWNKDNPTFITDMMEYSVVSTFFLMTLGLLESYIVLDVY